MNAPAPMFLPARATVLKWVFLLAILIGGSRLALHAIRTMHHSDARTINTKAASEIHKGIMLYANDHDGQFPTSTGSASDAYRKLFPDYLQNEELFYVAGSAWHNESRTKRPDGKIGMRPDCVQCLERGENHWAYVSGLATESDSNLPLFADGFVEEEPGRYTDDPSKKGGVRKGKMAIVAFVSGSVKGMNLSQEFRFRVTRPVVDPSGVKREVDLFSREVGLPEEARVLNPW